MSMSNQNYKDLKKRWEEDKNPFSVNRKNNEKETNIKVVIKDGEITLLKDGKEIREVKDTAK